MCQPPSLAEYSARWLNDWKGKASTHRFYDVTLTLYVLPVIGPRAVSSLTRADCRQVVTVCREKGLKLGTVRGVQRTLSAVLSQAVEDGLLAGNPAFRMGKYLRPGDEEPKPEIHPLTREQARVLLETVNEHWPKFYGFFLCALRTGLRLGELLALQWSDIDFGTRSLTVQRNLVAGRLTTPKNRKRRRVDMSLMLTETLAQQLKEARKTALKEGKPLPAWVFPNRDGWATRWRQHPEAGVRPDPQGSEAAAHSHP